MTKPDSDLWKLVRAIIAHDDAGVSRLLAASPALASACFQAGASRQAAKNNFLDEIKRYVYAGDTALHIAAAACDTGIVRLLLAAGADIHARNRFGSEPLHAACDGHSGPSQADTINQLIDAGADPNVVDKRGVAPLHKAIRNRSAVAVQTLLERGADPKRKNGNGSTPMLLAKLNTGKSGSGSPEAKAQQQEILRLLGNRRT